MIYIKEIPGCLQCSYCIRNVSHGGECHNPLVKNSEGGCLAFKMDPKGCIRSGDMKIPFPLYFDIPPLNTWSDGWTIGGVDTEISIESIRGIKWDTKKGNLIIYCRCRYYINEYQDNDVDPKDKPKLKLVK